MLNKQVDKFHYSFEKYMSKARWASIWHQVDEIQRLDPKNVLEIGPGSGVFKQVASVFDISVETFDIDSELNPDHVGSVTAMPFSDASYDIVCAFQMLEHLPYEQSLLAFDEMLRVSRYHVIISLPNAETLWRYNFYVPKIGSIEFFIPKPLVKPRAHTFDGEHYWEIGKKDFNIKKIISDFTKKIHLIKTYRVPENPYHQFFVFSKSWNQRTRNK